MKIARIEDRSGWQGWALLDSTERSLQRIRAPFKNWAGALAKQGLDVLQLDAEKVDLSGTRLLAPVDPGGRVFGVGLNYLAHLTRLGSTAPPHCMAYFKPDSAVVNPGGEIRYPAVTQQLDYEIELVAVLGRPLGDEPNPIECLLGYTIGNDTSARDAGKALGRLDLFTQKGLDSSAPIGPWITTLDAFGSGQPEVDFELSINGEIRQQDNTRNMIFKMTELLDFVDARVALRPGDVLFTGTTCGVGLEDGRFLKPGDKIEMKIEHIGAMSNVIGARQELRPARRTGRLGLPA
jgi:2-keto-4-pentenoate hydratase/2-oxohepta-3-ene-1,7-dioic acid hydratase in catechol pathway